MTFGFNGDFGKVGVGNFGKSELESDILPPTPQPCYKVYILSMDWRCAKIWFSLYVYKLKLVLRIHCD